MADKSPLQKSVTSSQDEDELEFVNKISKIVISAHDIRQICEGLATELSKRIPIEWASIGIAKGRDFHFQPLSSKIKPVWETDDIIIPIRDSAIEHIITTKQILYESNLSREIGGKVTKRFQKDKNHLREEIRSIIYAPFLSEKKVFGALIIASTQPDAYEARALNLLFHATNQIAMPLKNAILLDEFRRSESLLRAINELTRIILSDVSLDNVYEAFSERLRKLVKFDRLSIALIEGKYIRYFAVSHKIKTERAPNSIYPLNDSRTGWVAKHKKSLIIKDLTKNQELPINGPKIQEGLRSSLHVPLFYKGEVLGTINLSSCNPNEYGRLEKETLEHLSGQIAGAIMNAYFYKKIEEESRLDALTGLFNRRYFNNRLQEEISRRLRHGGVFSLALCDLDFFKQYNDRHGHIAGDKLLEKTGRLIKDSVRSIDLAFRYGGDEFIILLPDTELDEAFSVAERMRKNIEEEMRKREISLTISIGLASWPANGIKEIEILNATDSAVYKAKFRGGNQIIYSK